MMTTNSARLEASPASSSRASSIKSSKFRHKISDWCHTQKENVKVKFGKAPKRSLNNSPSKKELMALLTVNSLSIKHAPEKSILAPVVHPVISLNIFPKNTTRTVNIDLPKIGQRIEDVAQLVHCARLLQLRELPASHSSMSSMRSTLQRNVRKLPISKKDLDWLKTVENKSSEMDMIGQLLIGIVNEFILDPVKDDEAIREIVLVGPVLQKGPFRSLVTCFLTSFKTGWLLDDKHLQGLTQLVQDAPPGYIEADDLIKILEAIANRMQNTHSESDDLVFHLTVAVSKVLGVMADQNVQGLDRVLLHDSLGKALTSLKNHNNPFLRYQAIYASQALQWVPSNESQMHRSLRLLADMATGLIKVAGVVQLDFKGFLGGLKDIQKAAEETVDILKAGVEDLNTMIENGQELAECLKGAFGSRQKALWYISLRAAQELVRRGQLADLNTLIYEAPSHKGYLFQWGICQLLGCIAVDPSWDQDTREQALRFLEEMFTITTVSNVKQWILTILKYISTVPAPDLFLDVAVEEAINVRASEIFENLENRSDEKAFPFPYLLEQRLPLPKVSKLLRRVNKTANLEFKLLKIQIERSGGHLGVYIPLMSKASLQDPGEKLDPLEDRMASFLDSKKEIMLILGDSGSGKSLYNQRLERTLWAKYQPGASIPLHIDLKTMGKLGKNDIVTRKLASYGFTDVEIQELKEYRRVILICDGYDECRQWVHLHSRVKDERWKYFQIVVTCRIQYLTPAYRTYFVPPPPVDNQNDSQASSLFEEVVIVPFKLGQIEDFINQFRKTKEAKQSFDGRPIWDVETYMKNLSNLKNLVKNPLMLKLVLVTLPNIVGRNTDLSMTTVTRFSLYYEFIRQRLEKEAQRLAGTRASMKEVETEALNTIEANYVVHSIHFLMRLAHAVFLEQEGVNAIEYSEADKRGWKAQFFGPKATPDVKLLRQSCLLVNYPASESSLPKSNSYIGPKKTIFSFCHRSILEFFYSCRLCDFVQDLRDMDQSSNESRYSDLLLCLDPTSDISMLVAHPLNQRSIVSDSSVLYFLVEHTNADPQFKSQLHRIVNLSKEYPTISQASANSMTILVQAGVQFNGADLRGIRIPRANLSGGHFDSALLQDSDMTGVDLAKSWLRRADLSNAQMSDVQFGEKPFLKVDGAISMALSPDKKILALGFEEDGIKLFNTAGWSICRTVQGDSDRVLCMTFSSTGRYLASGGQDANVQVWELQRATKTLTLQGHKHGVTSIAFSPDEKRLVSGDGDGCVLIWNLESESPGRSVTRHRGAVWTLAWSPNGQQIASAGEDKTIRLWQVSTGLREPGIGFESSKVWSLLYIHDGQHLVVGTEDEIFVWDLLHPGNKPRALNGHTGDIFSLAISPNGQWIVSGSQDGSAKIWSEQTGEPVHTFNGHSDAVLITEFLNDREVISLSADGTVRVWELSKTADQKDKLQKQELRGHVTSVAYSSDGTSILSTSSDKTVREWDSEMGNLRSATYYPCEISQATYAPDGQQMVLSAERGGSPVMVGRISGEDITVSMQDIKSVTSMTYSPCGRWIATGDATGSVRLRDMQSGMQRHALGGHKDSITGLVFAPTNELQLASRSLDQTVRVTKIVGGERLSAETRILNAFAQTLVFSPCGKMIAWAGCDITGITTHVASDIHLWDIQSKQERYVLKGHSNKVQCLAWSLEWIVSGGKDATVRLWKKQFIESTPTWNCLAVIKETMGAVPCIAWNPRRPYEFVCGGTDSSVCVWSVTGDDSGQVDVRLKWALTNRFVAIGANIADAKGLDGLQRRLLQQSGAIDTTLLENEREGEVDGNE